MRTVSQTEYMAAWICGAGTMLVLLGWRIDESLVIWSGGAAILIGLLLWLRRANRRKSSKWIKENEDV